MVLLIGYVPDRSARTRITKAIALTPRACPCVPKLAFCEEWTEIHAVAATSVPHVLIFDPYAHGDLDLASCASFARAFPSTVLIAYGDFRYKPARDIVRLVQVGIRDVAERGASDSTPMLSRLLNEAVTHALLGDLFLLLQDRLTPEVLRVLQYVVTHPDEALGPDQLAKLCHCHAKTLREHLKKVGLPSTRRLIGWVRLLSAAHLLRDPARSVETVALQLGFPSANALRNQMHRYAGVGPRELQAVGGPAHLLRVFDEECARRRPMQRSRSR